MEQSSKIYIAGHRGMVGSAIVRKLENLGFTNIIYRTSSELDLKNQIDVENFFSIEKPVYVFVAAAKVGGIVANNIYRAEFIYENLMIQNNLIHSAHKFGVTKLLFLGSSCIYPKNSPQPIMEDYLMTGYLEPTNEPYAIAKIAGIRMCQAYKKQYGCNFISIMPPNLYGIGDNYNLQNAHVLPALLRKFHEAKINNQKSVVVWGTGKPRREFLFVDDAAMACYFLMQKYDSSEIINIGTGLDHTIMEMATLIKKITNYSGTIEFDESKPDGTPRKLLNVDKINKLGWQSTIDLEAGLQITYNNFEENYLYYTSPKNTRNLKLINV